VNCYRLLGLVEEPEPELLPEFGRVVVEPGVVDDPEPVDEPDPVEDGEPVEGLLVPGSHGGAICPGEPSCGSLWMRPEFAVLLRAVVPSCVVVDDPLRVVVLLLPLPVLAVLLLEPLWLLAVWPEVEPLPDDVRPDEDVELELAPLPVLVLLVLDEPLAGVHGIWVVLDGVCDDDPVDELCAAAYPPIESAAANANALIVVMYRFMSFAPRCQMIVLREIQ
jgi:hypothetical protein